MPEAIHYDVHSVCMYHSYYTYKKWEAELDLLTTSITLPAKVMGCAVHEQALLASTGLGATHTITKQQFHLNVYASGYTHDVAYKRAGVASVQGGCVFKRG